jgi:hypothetical protein
VTAGAHGDRARVYLLTAGDEIARRRRRVPRGRVAEAWPDISGRGFWVGEESKSLLDAAGEAPLVASFSLPAIAVAVYYGPWLCDLESLPSEESLRSRVLSAHGIAVAWITIDRLGQRAAHEPTSPADPIFHLRRPGGTTSHLWRLFQTRSEAVAVTRELFGSDPEAAEWARALAVPDFDALLGRDARPEG